jgi:hypothetical protein
MACERLTFSYMAVRDVPCIARLGLAPLEQPYMQPCMRGDALSSWHLEKKKVSRAWGSHLWSSQQPAALHAVLHAKCREGGRLHVML